MYEFEEIKRMNDEQLEQWTATALTDSQSKSGMAGEWASNRLRFGLTVMQLRSQHATRTSIADLQKSINDFNASSDRSATVIIRLTWALLTLTVVMAVPVLKELVTWAIHGFRLR